MLFHFQDCRSFLFFGLFVFGALCGRLPTCGAGYSTASYPSAYFISCQQRLLLLALLWYLQSAFNCLNEIIFKDITWMACGALGRLQMMLSLSLEHTHTCTQTSTQSTHLGVFKFACLPTSTFTNYTRCSGFRWKSLHLNQRVAKCKMTKKKRKMLLIVTHLQPPNVG